MMNLKEALEILVTVARQPLTNDYSDEEVLIACEVVESYKDEQ